jgi:hypothetical protein
MAMATATAAEQLDTQIEALIKNLEEKIAEHGEHSVQAAPAYVAYAKALLQKAQLEGDPFGGALKKEEDAAPADDDEDAVGPLAGDGDAFFFGDDGREAAGNGAGPHFRPDAAAAAARPAAAAASGKDSGAPSCVSMAVTAATTGRTLSTSITPVCPCSTRKALRARTGSHHDACGKHARTAARRAAIAAPSASPSSPSSSSSPPPLPVQSV